MKIICTVTNDLTHDQRMHRICSALVDFGHQVTLVGRRLPGSKPLIEHGYQQHRIECRYHRGKRFYAEYNYRLWRTLRRWSYDAICSVDLDTLLAGYLLTRDKKSYWTYDAHEWFSETPEVHPRPLVRLVWRTLGRWLVPKTNARYTVGRTIAEKLIDDYGVSFGVVRNMPDQRKVENKENVKGVILYQGMLNPGRGLETIIDALPHLPGCKLWIAGSGPLDDELRAQVAYRDVADRVTFYGLVDPQDLPKLTQHAWLGLNLLAAVSPSYYYSLANKSLDYLQARLPSLQMDFPEYRHLNETYGCYLLLPDLGARTLVQCIRELLADPDKYDRLVAGCDRAAGECHWQAEQERLREFYPPDLPPYGG